MLTEGSPYRDTGFKYKRRWKQSSTTKPERRSPVLGTCRLGTMEAPNLPCLEPGLCSMLAPRRAQGAAGMGRAHGLNAS